MRKSEKERILAAATWGVAGGVLLKMLLDGGLGPSYQRYLESEIIRKREELEELENARDKYIIRHRIFVEDRERDKANDPGAPEE